MFKKLKKSESNFAVSIGYNYNKLILNEESQILIEEFTKNKKQLLRINQELPQCLWIIQPKQRKILLDTSIANLDILN